MSTLVVRWIFAALCGTFFIAIGGIAVWEWLRFSRGESALTAQHLRFRLLSGVTWLLVLAGFFISTVYLWPRSSADRVHIKQFVQVSGSALALMLVAFALMSLDIFWTVQIGRIEAAKRARQSKDALERELARAQRAEQGGSDETA